MSPKEVVTKLNEIWPHESADRVAAAVRPLFADDAVIVSPDQVRVVRSGDAAAASYEGFLRNATVSDLRFGEPVVDEFGDCAVATVAWSMAYELQGVRMAEEGHDVYVLRRLGDRWAICWREIVPRDSSPPRP